MQYKKLLSHTTKNEFTKKLAKVDTSGNLSSVTYRSIDILKGAFIEKPFGWGLIDMNAFNHVNKIEPPTHDTLFDYNKKDGTNNLAKCC